MSDLQKKVDQAADKVKAKYNETKGRVEQAVDDAKTANKDKTNDRV